MSVAFRIGLDYFRGQVKNACKIKTAMAQVFHITLAVLFPPIR